MLNTSIGSSLNAILYIPYSPGAKSAAAGVMDISVLISRYAINILFMTIIIGNRCIAHIGLHDACTTGRSVYNRGKKNH